MGQAADTLWEGRIESVGVASIPVTQARTASAKVKGFARRRTRAQRFVDGLVLAIMLAAAATCASVYSRARVELSGALAKNEAAGEKVKDLTIKLEKLERDVQQLRTDSRAIELVARHNFGFVRSGDVVIKLAQAQSEPAIKPAKETSAKAAKATNLTSRASDGYTDSSN